MGRGWEGDVHPCDAEGRAGAGGLPAVGRTCGRRYQDRGIDGRSGDDRLRRLGDRRHELFEESMYEDLKDFAYPNSIKNLKIRFSKLENPGLFGAASLCYDK